MGVVMCYTCMSSCLDTDGEKNLAVHFIQGSPVVVKSMKKMLMYTSLNLWLPTLSRLSTLMLCE